MATRFYVGGYGSGKSYGALYWEIYHELTEGERCIVTNLALDPKKLNELLHRRFPTRDLRPLQRIRIINDDQVPRFFCHRMTKGGWEYDIPVPTPEQEKRGVRPDFTLWRDNGCLFVLDEFHEFFNSRLWMEVGRSVGWYKNQQRKLGDDIIAVTPNIEEIDKQFRSIGSEYREFINLGKRKYKGMVLPQKFIYKSYLSIEALKRRGKPFDMVTFSMDFELAACYDTARGVKGIQGNGADIGKRPKGVPFWMLPVVFVVLAILLFVGLKYANPYFTKKLARKIPISQIQDLGSPPASPVRSAVPASPSLPPADGPSQKTNLVSVVGYSLLDPRSPVVYLSDGSSIRPPRVRAIGDNWVDIDGERFSLIPPSPSSDNPVVQVSSDPSTWGQVSPPAPVNLITVGPTIHGRGGPPPPRLNAIQGMAVSR